MSPHRVALFLPCRAGSERVPDKNTRPFAGHAGGLLELKLDQLEALAHGTVDAVVLDTNDARVLELGQARARRWRGSAELIVRTRPDELGSSQTTTDALIEYALSTIACETLAWTHVTSPFFDAHCYERAVERFVRRDLERHDSLMTVTPLRGFIWDAAGPVNYRREERRWPRTQDLAPLYEVNSALFMVPREVGRERGDRIGARPILYETPHAQALDIDWPEDFANAEALYRVRAGGPGADAPIEVGT